jgi:hypothetical protein
LSSLLWLHPPFLLLSSLANHRPTDPASPHLISSHIDLQRLPRSGGPPPATFVVIPVCQSFFSLLRRGTAAAATSIPRSSYCRPVDDDGGPVGGQERLSLTRETHTQTHTHTLQPRPSPFSMFHASS